MASWLARYRQALEHQHGWDVPLPCGACNARAVPIYHGWKPTPAMGTGTRPTIYAELSCAECGGDLREAAREELVRLFAEVPIPAENRRYLRWFLVLMVGLPLALIAVLGAGSALGLWSLRAFVVLALLSVFIGPAIMGLNYKIASLRQRCVCGAPRYVFMGMLGRTYCYRCASCGKLLRLRD